MGLRVPRRRSWELDPARLYVYRLRGGGEVGLPKDDESVELWRRIFKRAGIDAKPVIIGDPTTAARSGCRGAGYSRTARRRTGGAGRVPPEKMPAREPGGPDSEIFYDFGTPHDERFGRHCHPNCDCGRFMEIGNSVFMEYTKTEDGRFEKLPQRNVDFGGGLERISAAVTGNADMFQIDTLKALIDGLPGSGYAVEEDNSRPPARRGVPHHRRRRALEQGQGLHAPKSAEKVHRPRRDAGEGCRPDMRPRHRVLRHAREALRRRLRRVRRAPTH